MPGARRNPGKNGPGRIQVNVCQTSQNNSTIIDDKRMTDTINGKFLAPKHVPIPAIPVDDQLTFEILSLAISIIAASLQLLNLYKTVWWLPQSYNQYTLNFYLIDPYLLVFIITMVTRKFIYTLCRKFIDSLSPPRWLSIFQKTMRIILLMIIMLILSWCIYYISKRHNIVKVFYLCYPTLSVYILLFGRRIGPFFDISTVPSTYTKEDKKIKYLLDKPFHNCSLNANAIRSEVSNLIDDFNCRLKRALFSSSASAYICGIAPVIFAPQQLHYNIPWVVQHIVLFWLGRLGAHFAQAYPVRYCDVLHRASLHLGKWTKVENKICSTQIQTWSDSVLWPNGSLVKHNKDTYRSDGLCTAAEPGEKSQHRFHALFNNPTMLLLSVLGLQILLVSFQLLILIRTVEWYQILSMTLLLLTNYYTLFKLARDYIVCSRVYRTEKIVQERTQTASIANIAVQ